MQEDTKRNERIYNKKMGIGYKRTYTYRELAAEHKFAVETIFKIVKRIRLKKELEALKAK